MKRRAALGLGALIGAATLTGCGAGAGAVHHPTTTLRNSAPPVAARRDAPKPPAIRRARPRPPGPRVLPAASASGPTGFVAAVTLNGTPVVRVARTPAGVTLLSFDQRGSELHLHSGTLDAGSTGWRFGPEVIGSELRQLVAGFNGGFRLNIGAGGFRSYGRTAVALRGGLGSVVTYSDGYTAIGSWLHGVPAAGHGRVVSVRQNLGLLVDHGAAGSTGCISCWGATLGGVPDPARSALGITASGDLIWAGGERLTVSGLADALLGAGVVRAVELDINPEWVAAYLYPHRASSPGAPIPMLAGQHGIPGQLLTPASRDFFTIVTRPARPAPERSYRTGR